MMERIDLSTNGKQIGAAYDEIRNATSSNTWAVFGYDGKSPTLIVKEIGDDWDELVDEMSASKILYAYIRVVDTNTGLNKFVLINWSGEAVPSSIKGPRAYHIPDIERLLHTKHVTINARNEDDLDEKLVKDRVCKSSGSNYSFHQEKAKKQETVGPVGAAYTKTDAQGEITSSGRSKFWQKQDIEEKGRIQEESSRLTRTRSEAEKSMKERDSSESVARSQRVEKQQRTVESQKAQERESWTRDEQERKRAEQEQFDRAGRELNQERDEAMHQVPSYRQEASHIQAAQAPQYTQPESPPAEVARAPLRPPLPQEVDSSPVREYGEPDEEPAYETAQEVPGYQQEPQPIYDDVTEQPQYVYDDVAQPPQGFGYPEQDAGTYDEIGNTLQGMNIQDNTPKGEPSEDIYDEIETAVAPAQAGFSVRAIYDYTAAEEGEISFDPGDIITDVDPIDEGWWQGTAPNGEYGLFPATYVENI